MASRFLEKLVSPVIAGLVLSAVGLVSLPTGAAPAPTEAVPDGPIFTQLSEVQLAHCRRPIPIAPKIRPILLDRRRATVFSLVRILAPTGQKCFT
jgi:hypothetical protein